MNKLKQLDACGQSPSLDYLKRSLIGETDEYADALKQFQSQADHGASAIDEHLAIADIRFAADVLRAMERECSSSRTVIRSEAK